MDAEGMQTGGAVRVGFLSRGFRPFFLGASVLAALAAPLWVAAFAGWLPVLTETVTLDWHAHEMIFGYTAGVIGGFVLTAVPNWTGRPPVSGRPLAALFLFWICGRAAMLAEPAIGAVPAALADAPFLVVLAGYLLREITASRNLRNLPIAGLVSVLARSNIFWHVSADAGWDTATAERCGLAVIALLITVVGGRITPSFTHNWLKKAGLPADMPGVTPLDMAAIALSGAGLALWAVRPDTAVTGAALAVAALAVFVRLSRWRGLQTLREPLVLILHVGYLWLSLSFALMALAAFFPDRIAGALALHSLTAGAIGTMTLAVMTRATLGHTGAPLRAGGATVTIYLLVVFGALTRVLSGLTPEIYVTMVALGGILWSSAFALFVASYGPRLIRPEPA